jgi:hypothetical protein
MYSGSPSPRILSPLSMMSDDSTPLKATKGSWIHQLKTKVEEQTEIIRIQKIQLAKNTADYRSQAKILQNELDEKKIEIHKLQDELVT